MKGINLIKVFKIKDFYKLYTIIKDKASEYKSYIYFNKYFLDLVYFNIISPFNCDRKKGKYFIIFLDDYNKYLEIKI